MFARSWGFVQVWRRLFLWFFWLASSRKTEWSNWRLYPDFRADFRCADFRCAVLGAHMFAWIYVRTKSADKSAASQWPCPGGHPIPAPLSWVDSTPHDRHQAHVRNKSLWASKMAPKACLRLLQDVSEIEIRDKSTLRTSRRLQTKWDFTTCPGRLACSKPPRAPLLIVSGPIFRECSLQVL